MKMTRLAIAAVLGFSILLTACGKQSDNGDSAVGTQQETQTKEEQGGTGSEQAKSIKIAYSCQDLTNTYFVEVANGVKARCEELGIEVNIVDGKADAANQVTSFENFIAEGLDGIIVSPVDEASLVSYVEAAQEAGIPVIAGNQLVKGTSAFVTVPEYSYGFAIGEAAGKWILEELDGKAKVAIFDYPELESVIDRGNGIQEGILSVAPEAQIVARQSANSTEKGMANMENILQSNPDVEVVVCVNDAGALGAYEAMMAAGKESDRVFIGGLDAISEALTKIGEGGIYRATVDIQPYETGKLFVDTLLKVIEEGPIEETIEIPMKVVDASNIADYQ